MRKNYTLCSILLIILVWIFSCKTTTEPPKSYQLNTAVEPEGSGSVQPSYPTTYEEGTMVTLTATPSTNWVFDHWSGDISSLDNPAEVEINEPKSVTANFVTEQFPLIMIIYGNGTVQKSIYRQKALNDTTFYEYNTLIHFTAVPDDGWAFEKWGGDLAGNTNPNGFRLNKKRTLLVYFKEYFSFTHEILGGGSIVLSPYQDKYMDGSSVQITAKPDDGWLFDHWEGDLTGNQNPANLIMDTDKSVNIIFSYTAPTSFFTINPTSGTTSTIFNFDASGSSDNEDATSALEIRWDWTNDGSYDTNWSTEKTISHQFSSSGTHTVKLEVKDSDGLTHMTTNQVNVNNPNGTKGTITDIDGNIYQTIQIGNQEWMAENLKVTRYRNGETISTATNNSVWEGLTTGAYCSYDNDDSNVSTYGRLYNWYAVDDSRGLAPAGWHVPSDEEWQELEMYLGMSQDEAGAYAYRGTDESSKLKSTGGWLYDWMNGTNESGFSAIPGGHRVSAGFFEEISISAYFWSSTEYNSFYALYRSLTTNDPIFRELTIKYFGFSIRCIRD